MSDVQVRLVDNPLMPRAGTVLKQRYEIIKGIGEGGFAAVYRALDRSTGADVAVKVLDPVMSRQPLFSQRFLREVETVARLRHHNTIKVSDKGNTDQGCLFLVMELLDGRPLDDVLSGEGALSPERVRRITTQVLKSLSEAHGIGIIHRDLKPANIFLVDMVGERDYVKVLDFGIAKSLDEGQENNLTSTGQVMCSPHYVAPERVTQHLTVPASDLYSLGVMMIELLEGKPPYDAPTPMQLLFKHAKPDEPVPMKPETLACPLHAVIQKATAKDPSQRYQSAVEMLDALSAIGSLKELPLNFGAAVADTATLSAAMPTAVDQASHPPIDTYDDTIVVPGSGNKRLLAAAIIFLIVAAAGTAIALFFAGSGSKSDTSTAAVEEPQEDPDTPPVTPPAQLPPSLEGTALSSTPPGAALRVNDRFIGTLPLTVRPEDLGDAPWLFTAELPGHANATRSFAGADALSDHEFVLVPTDVAVVREQGGTQTNIEASDGSVDALIEAALDDDEPARPAQAVREDSDRTERSDDDDAEETQRQTAEREREAQQVQDNDPADPSEDRASRDEDSAADDSDNERGSGADREDPQDNTADDDDDPTPVRVNPTRIDRNPGGYNRPTIRDSGNYFNGGRRSLGGR